VHHIDEREATKCFKKNITFFVIPRRANSQNTNARNANIVPPVLNHEVTNAEFRSAVHLLAQSMADNQQATVPTNSNGGSAATRV